MKTSILTAFGVSGALVCGHAIADPAADSFANIFATTCLKHVTELTRLQSTLEQLPKLAPDQSKFFLNGLPGSAWPVPDKNGQFVLAIPENKNLCAIYGRRANAESVESLVGAIVSTAPEPLRAVQLKDERRQDPRNGAMRTISYEWSIPGATRKLVFTLTTATGDAASIQALATAAIVQ